MELLPTRYLSVAGEYAGAVHIPLAELERRTHELPPPEREVWVVADSWDAYHALGWLHARGRRARLVSAPPPDADPTVRYRLWTPNAWLETVLYAWETATQAEFRIAPSFRFPPLREGNRAGDRSHSTFAPSIWAAAADARRSIWLRGAGRWSR
jgi:hypothetical protein